MKKKLLAILMMGVMAASLAACGGSGAASSAAASSAAPAAESSAAESKAETTPAKDAKVIKVANYYADTHPMNITLNEVFKPMVEEGTEGRYVVEIYSNNALGAEAEYTEGCKLGTIECGIAGVMLSDQHPALKVINFPWLFDNATDAAAVLNDEDVAAIIDEAVRGSGVTFRGAVANGERAISNNVHPINSLADCKGLKIRMPEVSHFVANGEALGFNVVTMGMSEIFTALQQGVIDAQENPPTTLLTSGWYEVQPYLAITNHQVSFDWIMFNAAFYDGMAEEDRAVLDEACKAFIDAEVKAYIDASQADIEKLKELGIEVTYPDREEFKAAGSVVIDSFCDQYPEFKEMVELIRSKQG